MSPFHRSRLLQSLKSLRSRRLPGTPHRLNLHLSLRLRNLPLKNLHLSLRLRNLHLSLRLRNLPLKNLHLSLRLRSPLLRFRRVPRFRVRTTGLTLPLSGPLVVSPPRRCRRS